MKVIEQQYEFPTLHVLDLFVFVYDVDKRQKEMFIIVLFMIKNTTLEYEHIGVRGDDLGSECCIHSLLLLVIND